MIFKQWQQVLDGTKTQTRRLVKQNEFASGHRLPHLHIYAVWIDNKGIYDRRQEQHGFVRAPLVILEELYRLKWAVAFGPFVDKTYAIQPGRGKKAVGRIRITEIRRERVQDISYEDVLAEGITEEKLKGWPHKIGFQALWDSIHKKPDARWADNPEVWVLTFELVGGNR